MDVATLSPVKDAQFLLENEEQLFDVAMLFPQRINVIALISASFSQFTAAPASPLCERSNRHPSRIPDGGARTPGRRMAACLPGFSPGSAPRRRESLVEEESTQRVVD